MCETRCEDKLVMYMHACVSCAAGKLCGMCCTCMHARMYVCTLHTATNVGQHATQHVCTIQHQVVTNYHQQHSEEREESFAQTQYIGGDVVCPDNSRHTTHLMQGVYMHECVSCAEWKLCVDMREHHGSYACIERRTRGMSDVTSKEGRKSLVQVNSDCVV